MKKLATPFWLAVSFALIVPGIARSAPADIAYITGNTSIWKWDTGTNTVSLVVNTGFGLDSLIFGPTTNPITTNNIISSRISANQLGSFNGVVDTTFSNSPNLGPGVADMALEPGGGTLLVGNAFGTTVSRVNAVNGNWITNLNVGFRPDGIAYDDSGNLYMVLNRNEIARVDPTNGNVLQSLTLVGGQADALSFDSTTGRLYVSNDVANGGYWIVPTSLASQQLITLGVDIDGLAANGNHLYLIQRNVGGLQVDLATNAITLTSPGIAGADDIAPFGFPSANPEPATLLLVGIALAGVAATKRRRIH